jgi:hypothetical protein
MHRRSAGGVASSQPVRPEQAIRRHLVKLTGGDAGRSTRTLSRQSGAPPRSGFGTPPTVSTSVVGTRRGMSPIVGLNGGPDAQSMARH